MLPEARDHLASLDVRHNKFVDRITKLSKQATIEQPIRIPGKQNSTIVTSQGKIVFPRNFVDDIIEFFNTPFSDEKIHLLRYQRAVAP